jgi:hypothetical protein
VKLAAFPFRKPPVSNRRHSGLCPLVLQMHVPDDAPLPEEFRSKGVQLGPFATAVASQSSAHAEGAPAALWPSGNGAGNCVA